MISYVAAFFSLVGIWLNIKKRATCWYFFMISDSLWFTYSLHTSQWSLTIVHVCFMMVNIYGLVTWSKKLKLVNQTPQQK